MGIRSYASRAAQLVGCAIRSPLRSLRLSSKLPERLRANEFCRRWPARGAASRPAKPTGDDAQTTTNPLRSYFQAHKVGRGIWKWNHYFDIYHRHLAKFIGTDVTVAEIGIYSGGSLGMWQAYFGHKCRVVGVDIEEACRAYEDERTRILIGDQGNREFWRAFREQVSSLDVLIDDGSHKPLHQMITLEEILPYLRPGGVYICEDVHRVQNRFAAYAQSLANELNAFDRLDQPQLSARTTALQSCIESVHFYPYVVVIERTLAPVDTFDSPMQGTEWQPFLITERTLTGRGAGQPDRVSSDAFTAR